MMKHVQLSPYRGRADTVSISSSTSYGSLSPEETLGSRSSSFSSLNDSTIQQTTGTSNTIIKVYAKCLRSDIEYKTLSITFQTTCKQVVTTLLGKYKMKHRDPKLFYLSMEVTVRKAGVRTYLALDDEARPAVLQSCHPKGDSKFSLQIRKGGLVKVYDSILNCNSQYKSLLISVKTTVDELIALLLNCYNAQREMTVEQFSLYEVNPEREQQRKLHPDDRPLQIQQTWLTSAQKCHFLLRRNPDYYLPLSRRKVFCVAELPPLPPSSSSSPSKSLFKTSSNLLQLSSKSSPSLLTERKITSENNKLIKPLPSPSSSPSGASTIFITNQSRSNKPNKDSMATTNTSSATTMMKYLSNTELKVFDCNAYHRMKKNGQKPSYADYDNYFYI